MSTSGSPASIDVKQAQRSQTITLDLWSFNVPEQAKLALKEPHMPDTGTRGCLSKQIIVRLGKETRCMAWTRTTPSKLQLESWYVGAVETGCILAIMSRNGQGERAEELGTNPQAPTEFIEVSHKNCSGELKLGKGTRILGKTNLSKLRTSHQKMLILCCSCIHTSCKVQRGAPGKTCWLLCTE